MRRFARKITAVVAAAVAAVALTLAGGPAASALPVGTIAGTVTIPYGVGITPDLFIMVIEKWDGPVSTNAGQFNLDPTGNFSVDVEPGDYALYFSPDDSIPGNPAKDVYPVQWNGGAFAPAELTTFAVTSGMTTTVNHEMIRGGFIQVHVDFGSTATHPSFQWAVSDATGTYGVGRAAAGEHFSMAAADYDPDAGGTGYVGPLLPGTYRLCAMSPLTDETAVDLAHAWANQCWDHVNSVHNASQVTVAAGMTATGVSFDFVRLPTGSISGTVRDSVGDPVPGAYVGAESTDGVVGGLGDWTGVADSSGNYTIRYLAPGDYTVFAFDGASDFDAITEYEFYSGRSVYDDADLVTVGTTNVTPIDFHLGTGLAPLAFQDFLRYQAGYVPPPAFDTSALLTFLSLEGIDIDSLDDWAADFSANTITVDNLPWLAEDRFIDIFGYSTGQYLGTFPVKANLVSFSVSTASLGAGVHHVVLVGRDSGDVQAAKFGTALASTGTDAAPIALIGGLLLAAGVLMLVRRRRLQLS
jgi:LPXTG-motif cell wall-anchored protein